MSDKFVFTTRDLEKSYGQKKILARINLSFFAGAKIGIVGENGSGKSTLLRIMAGIDQKFDGYAAPAKNVRIGYVPQEPHLDTSMSVRENLLLAFAGMLAKLKRFDEISKAMEDPELDTDKMQTLMDEMAVLQDEIDAEKGWELDRQVEQAADALFIPDENADVTKLSGGELRRVFLCRTLLEKPDILLLDEPTNHLDAETISWLENHLREYPGTVIIVTHDRYFLDNITRWILELDRTRGIPFEGNYSSWLEQKARRLEEEGRKAADHQKSLQSELEWIRSSPGARRGHNMARVRNYEQLAQQNFEVREDSLDIQIPPGPHLGDKVITLEGVSKSYGARTLFDKFDLVVPPGAIVGIIGPNGVGKTTLFRMIVGTEQPDAGTVTLGQTVKLSHVDQNRDVLNDNKTIYEEISDGLDFIELGGRKLSSRAYVGRFNFKGADQQKRVGTLSGGERNRVHLAKLLRRGGNVLLLDEPTNDLDTDTLRHLEEGLRGFPSCALVISHDRFFLDRICSHLLAFEGEGNPVWYEGGFSEYEEKKLAQNADPYANRRARYRKLRL